jgi:hypothetical protein
MRGNANVSGKYRTDVLYKRVPTYHHDSKKISEITFNNEKNQMKKLLSFLFIALLTVNPGITAQEKTEEPSLAGIWRMYLPIGDAGTNDTKLVLKPTGLHKIFYENGRFINLSVSSEKTIITVYGTYDILSPTQYVEHIEKSFYSAHAGADNILAFKFRDADCLILSFSLQNGRKIEEIWCRVKTIQQ